MIVKNQIVGFIFNITKSFGIRGSRVGNPSIGRLVLLVTIVLIGVGLRFHAIDREPSGLMSSLAGPHRTERGIHQAL
jgi:hypothetical protein